MKSFIATLSFLFLPLIVRAQEETPQDFKGFVDTILGIISLIIPFLISLAFIIFLWGMAIFILKADNEESRANGKRLIIWGALGLFVMISIWGIVGILLGSFGFGYVFPQL